MRIWSYFLRLLHAHNVFLCDLVIGHVSSLRIQHTYNRNLCLCVFSGIQFHIIHMLHTVAQNLSMLHQFIPTCARGHQHPIIRVDIRPPPLGTLHTICLGSIPPLALLIDPNLSPFTNHEGLRTFDLVPHPVVYARFLLSTMHTRCYTSHLHLS